MTIVESPIAPPSSLPGASQAPGTYPTSQARSEAALTALQEVISAYPSSDAAVTARYEAAGQLLALGRAADAEQMYRDVIARNSAVYTPGARLGLAQALAAGEKYDEAITTLNEVAAAPDAAVPVDGVLMHLGHTYAKAGKPQDAAAAYKRVTDEFPDSVYASDAKQRLAVLN
jgi:TolA-binding protein